MGVQKHYKKRSTKKIVSQSFYRKFDQKSKTDFFSDLFSHILGRFSIRLLQKHDKKYRKKSDPSLFSHSGLPTTGALGFFSPGRTLHCAKSQGKTRSWSWVAGPQFFAVR
jgi:hypothetical protein